MTKRDILIIPDRVLREVSAPVETIGDDTRALIDDMLETMYAAPGIGLAAIQIGIPQRVVTIDISKDDDSPPDPIALVNPEIIWTSEERRVYEEGCLSIPEYFEEVERPDRCVVRFQDRDGETREIEADGLLSTCVQHEMDHLNGVLFIDHLSRLKREKVMRKFTKMKRQAVA